MPRGTSLGKVGDCSSEDPSVHVAVVLPPFFKFVVVLCLRFGDVFWVFCFVRVFPCFCVSVCVTVFLGVPVLQCDCVSLCKLVSSL